MKLVRIEVNHMDRPIGFNLENHLHLVGFLDQPVTRKLQRQLTITANGHEVIRKPWEEADNLIYDFALELSPHTRYEVKMSVKDDDEVASTTTYFETGQMGQSLQGKWIGTQHKDLHSIILHQKFTVKEVNQARLYLTGLGLFEAYIDGQKVGDEFLTPGFTDYNYDLQLEPYDVTKYLHEDGEHELSIMLADGWYRGKLGLKTHGGQANNYGDQLLALAELRINDQVALATDDSWEVSTSPVTHSGIYYGEDLDDNRPLTDLGKAVIVSSPTRHLVDRQSLPIKRHEEFPVKKVIQTPSGSTVLDFGQNMAGWLEFKNIVPQGEKVSIEFGEIMQDGEFYRDNLRSARAQFTYVSDGREKWVRPHFTYFGFRYVKLSDFSTAISPADFRAVALYSEMRETGQIKTDNSMVNRLFENVKWGQKSNFVDIPTDCPQRDERLGWTGDAAIFAKTASYNMATYQFFKKYSYDVAVEQSKNNGFVPLYVPAVDTEDGGKAVWSDVSTIIPWVAYKRTGDKAILRQNIGAMMSWIDWIHDRAVDHGQEYLWLGDDQLGDWLALDTEDIMKLKGKTPDDLIASAYYYYSSKLVSQAANVLKMKHEEQYYSQLAKLIKQAFIEHFFTKDGLSIADTQTGLALCLTFGLYPKNGKELLVRKLVEKIEVNQNHLNTGFVGTPLLLPALTANGQENLALRLFLNTDFPSWLYEVKHGATTIWERWNSVDEDGHTAQNGMNSLSHYSSGAVMAWAYEDLLGLKQDGNNVIFKPMLTAKLKKISGQLALPTGLVKVSWQIISQKKIHLKFEVSYGSQLKLELPELEQELASTTFTSGSYELDVEVKEPIVAAYDIHTPLNEYQDQKQLTDELSKLVPFWGFLAMPGNMEHFGKYSLLQLSREMRGIGFKPFAQADIEKINQLFRKSALQGEEK
ncbi:family 78 glycoside hydrolase catalytic domain [Lactobacillus xujianguonis]|uniref:family 78 glycoside hydrolase catalytic domain n=1 Tax=Lactobacillus xujianguonis TaxID=2495899 RepID=UPI000FD706FB|nr:family 78 glycoside hydrolase catalytic domain [Lactobacillus xujianguonis]RVU73920.1 alfa-L-rhamnosidase [Lactobacillus xujianguonis]